MKLSRNYFRHILMLLFLCCFSAAPLLAQDEADNVAGPDWQKVSDAMELTRANDKMLLMDIYAEWCGFCRRMIEETYADESVRAVIDKYFIPVRLNGESTDQVRFYGYEVQEVELAGMLGITGFPTTYFFGKDGTPIVTIPGFIDPPTFTELLEYVGSEAYKEQSFEDFSEEYARRLEDGR